MDARLTLIGGPTLLLETAGLRLLTDQTFDAPQSYQSAGITLTKQSPPAIAAEALGRIDAVLLSHDQHRDNLDHAGRAFLPRADKVLTTREGVGRLGGNAVGLAPWESTTLVASDGTAIAVTATPARHGPAGIEPISGSVIGFVIGDAIYVSGDTVWYDGVAEIARRFPIRLAILFTGAAEPRGRFHVTMDSNDAIEAAHAFPDARIVAIHNEGWGHFTESQDDLAQAFSTLGLAARFQRLEPGESVRVSF